MDITINGKSLTRDYLCIITQVTITPLAKKEYTVDLPCADGDLDLSAWFGSPRFAQQTLSIELISANSSAETTAQCMIEAWLGQSVQVCLTTDPEHYRIGTVQQIAPAGANTAGAIRIKISCRPCRYFMTERTYSVAASTAEKSLTMVNDGTMDVVPTLTASGKAVTIKHGDATYTLAVGEYLIAGLAIKGKSSIAVKISGGSLTVKYREAIR